MLHPKNPWIDELYGSLVFRIFVLFSIVGITTRYTEWSISRPTLLPFKSFTIRPLMMILNNIKFSNPDLRGSKKVKGSVVLPNESSSCHLTELILIFKIHKKTHKTHIFYSFLGGKYKEFFLTKKEFVQTLLCLQSKLNREMMLRNKVA